MKQAVLALLFLSALSTLAIRDLLAPLHVAEDASHRIEGEYLVLFNDALTRPLCGSRGCCRRQRTFTLGDKFRVLHVNLSPKYVDAD
ncbi:uncharacterized protein ACA1_347790 [Acanthamoeba castellanii str. Neff]|uniref:Uncharacterized protein n=1 Tax=Acanthamoeba castellanii (strain ATCC 30010 / Neff) TaxID=1257118 RepID=L8GKB0_ACACF|nr:uncharacterized protein ACA1_347790 [Acanthamoeba castellanii str. Neff]ELR13279.1 hypothetical protein ACA1_347790 [Acanthamoeba castellanii str. Neff]